MSLSSDEIATLTARLAEAESALHGLLVGKATVQIAYDGESVTYSQADEGRLRRYIAELKGNLGSGSGAYRRGVRA